MRIAAMKCKRKQIIDCSGTEHVNSKVLWTRLPRFAGHDVRVNNPRHKQWQTPSHHVPKNIC